MLIPLPRRTPERRDRSEFSGKNAGRPARCASGWNSSSRGSSSPQAGAYEPLALLALQVSQARLLVAFSLAVLLDLSLGARHGAFAFEARAHEFLARVALQFFFARLLIAGAHAFLRLLRRLALVLAARERRCDHHRAKQNGE